MKVHLTRSSVAAGDDAYAPHLVSFKLDNDSGIDGLLSAIARLDYFPTISGGKATWTLSSRIPLAVFAQEWSIPKKILSYDPPMSDLDFHDGVLKLHLSYHAQIPPESVLEVLKRLRLTSIE